MSLTVIRLEDASHPCMSAVQKVFCGSISGFSVVQADMRDIKLTVKAVNKQNRNSGLLKAVI